MKTQPDFGATFRARDTKGAFGLIQSTKPGPGHTVCCNNLTGFYISKCQGEHLL